MVHSWFLVFLISAVFSQDPFKWNNCVASNETASGLVTAWTITQPIVGGCTQGPFNTCTNLTVNSFAVTINSAIDKKSMAMVQMLLSKKVGDDWIEIPCIDGYGSCTYAPPAYDLCSLIPTYFSSYCVILQQLGLSCACPYPKGMFKISKPLSLSIPQLVPAFLVVGDYYFKLIVESTDMSVMCEEVYFSVATPTQ